MEHMEIAMKPRLRPGKVRDAIVGYLRERSHHAAVRDIQAGVRSRLGTDVSTSSVRSYLRLNTPDLFSRVASGRYELRASAPRSGTPRDAQQGSESVPAIAHGRAKLFRGDCFAWMSVQQERSIHGVVTDPPYGLVEYSENEQKKLRAGHGGVWRIPPSFDGHTRAPLPRFTTLGSDELADLRRFFHRFGTLLMPILVPGAHVLIASNPLLSYLVAHEMVDAGFERRGEVIRLVMTMRGGDRPKNAHIEFTDVSVMPRSMWEPWLLFRKPIEGRVQDNLRRWKTGGLRRVSGERPFGDVIRSAPTHKNERMIAPHPSLKPQAFLRQVVRAILPLGEGVVLDPFAGSGSTLAACEAVGYPSVGVEKDTVYVGVARGAIPRLAALRQDAESSLYTHD